MTEETNVTKDNESKKEENLTEDKEIKEEKTQILPENDSIKKNEPKTILKNKEAKEGSFAPLIIFMFLAMVLAGLWDKIPAIKNSIHYVFDPSAGALLNWNLNIGMLIIVLIITALTTVIQKYATDQKTLKELKAEQKELQKQMKEFKNHPEKLMELQKRQFAMMPKQMKLSMRAVIYTGIPFILFVRWFNDYFSVLPEGTKFWLGLGWFWFYLISAIIFGSILRKWWDVV